MSVALICRALLTVSQLLVSKLASLKAYNVYPIQCNLFYLILNVISLACWLNVCKWLLVMKLFREMTILCLYDTTIVHFTVMKLFLTVYFCGSIQCSPIDCLKLTTPLFCQYSSLCNDLLGWYSVHTWKWESVSLESRQLNSGNSYFSFCVTVCCHVITFPSFPRYISELMQCSFGNELTRLPFTSHIDAVEVFISVLCNEWLAGQLAPAQPSLGGLNGWP
jgi:hypothetical protein